VFVAEDTGIVAVVEINLHSVVADLAGGLGANFGFEHGQGGGGDRRGGFCSGGVLLLLVALFVAGGAGAFFAKIRKIVMAGVIVGPGDVHTGSAGDVNFNVQRFFALINRDGHGINSGTAGLDSSVAAISWRDGITVRTGFWVTKKSADTLIEFGTDDVFEFAGLGVGFGIIDGESVFEKALCEAMTAHHVASAATAGVSEMHIAVAHLDEL
jgi:hypothetical protein